MMKMIKRFFISMNGAFLPKEKSYIDQSLMDFEAQMLADMKGIHSIEDRINMKQDVKNIRSDFQKVASNFLKIKR